MPGRIPSSSFPVAAAATAFDYASNVEAISRPAPSLSVQTAVEEQGILFHSVKTDSRVIPFDSLTTREERQSIHARAQGLATLEPLKSGKVQVKRSRAAKQARDDQQWLEFYGSGDHHPQPKSEIICDATVAPGALRLQAALVDLFIMAVPVVISIAIFFYAGGEFAPDKQTLPFFLLALASIPLFYKLLWTIAGRDTVGMRAAGLVLVDFDGNPPSQARRWLRCAGACLSFLAAGIGMVWSLVDEDRLTWHDHISSTFPAVAEASN